MFHLCRLIFTIISTSPQTSEKTSLICTNKRKKAKKNSNDFMATMCYCCFFSSWQFCGPASARQCLDIPMETNECQLYANHIISTVISRPHMISTDSQQSVMVHPCSPALDNGWWVCFNLTLLHKHNGECFVTDAMRGHWTIFIVKKCSILLDPVQTHQTHCKRGPLQCSITVMICGTFCVCVCAVCSI